MQVLSSTQASFTWPTLHPPRRFNQFPHSTSSFNRRTIVRSMQVNVSGFSLCSAAGMVAITLSQACTILRSTLTHEPGPRNAWYGRCQSIRGTGEQSQNMRERTHLPWGSASKRPPPRHLVFSIHGNVDILGIPYFLPTVIDQTQEVVRAALTGCARFK